MSFTVPAASLYVVVLDDGEGAQGAIDCGLAQLVAPIETPIQIVVVDGGSLDGSFELLADRYRDEPRVQIVDGAAAGVGAASNLALQHCRGPLVGRLRTNASVEPDALASLAAHHVDDSISVACGAMRIIDRSGEPVPGRFSVGAKSRFVMLHGWVAHPMRLFSRSAWERTSGFDESLTVEPDYDMFLKLAEVGAIAHEFAQITRLVFPGDIDAGPVRGGQRRDHIASLQRALVRRGHVDPIAHRAHSAHDDRVQSSVPWGLPVAHLEISAALSAEARVDEIMRKCAPGWALKKETVDDAFLVRTPALSPRRARAWIDRLTVALAPVDAHVELAGVT